MENKFISVVIPYYNDEKIDKCINGLLNQRYPRDRYEIIIVDNNSTQKYYGKYIAENVTVVEQPERGAYKSRNQGVKVAKGEIVAFTDSDCIIDSDWLKKINSSLNDSSDLYAVQGLSLSTRSNYVAKAINDLYEKIFFEEIVDSNEMYCSRIDTRNCAILRKCFDLIGMFNENLLYWGDAEYGKRIVENGKKIKYLPDMNIVHSDINELDLLINKRKREGRIVTQTFIGLGARYTKKYFPEMLFIFLGSTHKKEAMEDKILTKKASIESCLEISNVEKKELVKKISNDAFLAGVYDAIENKEKLLFL